MNTTPNKLHPLLIVAATSVTVASLAAIASFSGLLPLKSSSPVESTAATPSTLTPPATTTPLMAAAAPVAASEAPAASAAPAKIHKPVKEASSKPAPRPYNNPPSERTVLTQGSNYAAGDPLPPPSSPLLSPPICRECGTIESLHEVKTQAAGTGLGAIAGGVLGGLLGNQVGRGNGRDAATIVAAVGGAYAGHQVEKNVRADKQIEMTVRFDDGSIRTFSQQEASRWRQGDRIRLSNGNLLPI